MSKKVPKCGTMIATIMYIGCRKEQKMKNEYYFNFKKVQDKQSVMFSLIKMLSDHGQDGKLNLKRLYNIFTAIYREELVPLNKELPLDKRFHWHNFDELLKMPPKDWFRVNEQDEEYKNWLNAAQKRLLKKELDPEKEISIEDKEDLNYCYLKMLEQPLIHLSVLNFCNKIILTQEAEEYLARYKDKGFDQQNVEQSVMADIIKILRKEMDPLSYSVYNLIRSSVAAKDMYVNLVTKRVKPHFLEEIEFLKLRREIESLVAKVGSENIRQVMNLFEDLHDAVVGPIDIKYCRVCGNPVWGEECVGGILCSTKLKLGEKQYDTYHVDTGDTVYYLKDGVIRYNSIPGIDELWLYLKLVDKYKEYEFVKIEIYPGKDAEGDIAVAIGSKAENRIVIDLKGWRKSWMLSEKISKEATSFRNKDFLFVPVNLKLFYSNGLNGLNNTLKRNKLKTEAVSDKQLFSRIDDRIKLYLQNGKIEGDM